MALELHGVAKTYRGKVHALRGIDLNVGRGEVFGLLGPNGAGKSTLIKILMTVIRPSRCDGHMLGEPVGSKSVLRRIGYLPENHKFPGYLTGQQVLDFYGAMSCVDRETRRKRIPELLELVGMGEWGSSKLRQYSKGMRQRIGIAQALMTDPDLILLDEPTDGVDPAGRLDIRRMLEHMRDSGKTVFLNSHILSELEQVCSRVAILVNGEVAKQGDIGQLTAGKERYEIAVARDNDEGTQLAIENALSSTVTRGDGGFVLTGGQKVDIRGHRLRVMTDDPEHVQPLLDGLRAASLTVASLRMLRPSLEDLFMEAVSDNGDRRQVGASRGGKGRAN